jgi:putative aldouronate transport system substrate-binding protein
VVSAEEADVPELDAGISKYITPDNIEELIAGRPSVSLPLSEDGASLSFWTGSPSMDATISGWSDSTAAQELEKRTGVSIEYIEVAPPTQSESLNLMFASGDFPDIINYAVTGSYSVSYLIDNDIAIDLADMMDAYAPSYSALMEADPALYLATVDDDGQIGGLAGYQYNAFTTTGAIVRADWVEKVGMTPEDLVTIDDYYDYLSAIKSQGLCEYPMPLRFDASISGCPFLAAMGGYAGPAAESSAQSFYYDDNDELVYSYITDTYHEYLSLMAQWYSEGLITRDLLNSDMLDSSAITSGSYGIFWQDCQFMDSWTEAGQVNDPDYTLVGISEPLVEAGQTVGFGDITDISINLIITTGCADPELALQWLDYHFSEEGSILCQYGLEGEGLAYDENGKPDYSELISDNPDGLSTDNALNAYAVNINMYAKNGTTLRRAYDTMQQEALDAWNDCREVTKSSFVGLFTLDSAETATVQQYYTDISTYVAEQIGKFLVGEADVDADWDDFVSTVESMNIEEVIDAYRSAGERYFSRLD